jgi:hypothetical protein
MPCDRRDFGHGAAGDGKARDRSSSEIVQRKPDNAGRGAGLAPARSEPIRRPGLQGGAG